MSARLIAALAGGVVLAACGGESGARGAGAAPVPELTLELLHEIGSVDDLDQALTNVGDVRLAADGALFVEQDRDENVRVYGADGDFLGVVGSRGEGPAELRTLRLIGLHGDTLWAFDSGNRAVKRYRKDGSFVDSWRWAAANIESDGPITYSLRSPTGVHMERDGSAVVVALPMIMAQIGPGSLSELPVAHTPVVRLSPDGGVVDTIARVDQAGDPGAPAQGYIPFYAAPLMALLPGGGGVAWADRRTAGNPDPGTFRVTAVSLSGDLLFERVFEYEPMEIPADARAEAEAVYREVRDRNPEFVRDGIWFPESLPALSRLVGTSDGFLWLAREETRDPSLWWGLDPVTGEHVATLTLPAGERVVEQRGETLVTTFSDDLDVPYLRRYRVTR